MRKVCQLESCGIEFEATREDARFHSAVCRAKASRERRAEEGPDSGPSGRDEDPDERRHDEDRLSALEARVAGLQDDVEAVEGSDNLVRDLAKRLTGQEAVIRRAVQEAVAPIAREVAALKAVAVTRVEVADVRDAVDALGERLSDLEGAPVPGHDRKLVELEQGVITLANRTRKLREEFDALVRAIAAE